MGKIYIRKSNSKGKYRSLGFYTVLALSLMAAGAAAWSARVALPQVDDPVAQVSERQPVEQIDTPVSKQPADKISETSSNEEPQKDSEEQPVEEAPSNTATYFVLPVSGEVTKKFNSEELQYSETFGDMRIHNGIDIAADLDSRVKSAGNGVVQKIYNDELNGSTVVIDHGNGIVAYYCGLNDLPMVSEGQSVLAGTDLGSLSTIPGESADKPHLHLAIQKDGEWVSPLALMNMEE